MKFKNLDLSYRILLSVIFVLGAILIIFIRLQSKPEKSFAAWFDDAYTYRQTITITHNANVFANRAIGVSVSTSGLISASKMQSDCDDTRFTDSSGKVLPYQLVSGCNGTNTQYTVVVPRINSGTNYIYVYYGNPTATSNSQDVSGYTPLTPSTPGPAAASEEVSVGPIGYWKFNEGVGTTTSDSTRNNNNANFGAGTSAPSWITEPNCYESKCLSFDGSKTFLSIPHNSALGQTGDITISLWIKPTDFSVYQSMVFKGTSNIAGPFDFYLIQSTGLPRLLRGNGSGFANVDGTTAPTVGVWNHIEVTMSGTTVTHYLNGKFNGSGTLSTTIADSGNPLYFGTRASKDIFLKGSLDDVKIYPYARTSAQVLADYNSKGSVHGSSVNLGNLPQATNLYPASLSNGLLGWWKFDESSGNALDSSGIGNSLVNNNTTTYTSGKYGNAGTYNGSNQYFSTPTIFNGVQSISFWVKPASANDFFISFHDGAYLKSVSNILTPIGGLSAVFYVNGVVSSTLTTSAWNHVVATFPDPGTTAFEVGRDGATLTEYAANGTQIDDVRLYNRVLTYSEIDSLYVGSSKTKQPVSYWKFNEGVGVSAYDTTENSNNLTLNTASWTTNGKYNKAWHGNGSNWISRPNDDDFNFTANDNFSISLWFKSNSATNPLDAELLLTKSLIIDGGDPGYGLYTSGGNIVFGIRDDGSWNDTPAPAPQDSVSSLSDIYDGTWHNIVVTKTGTTRMDMYVDGQLNSSDTSISAGSLVNTDSLIIGDLNGGSGYNFNGDIDEIKIYRSALSASDVLIDYNRGQALVLGSSSSDVGGTSFSNSNSRSYCVPGDSSTCSAPLAYWNFEEGVGTSVYDNGTSAFNGTFGTGNSAPSWTNGKFGSALSFDGVNDKVVLTQPTTATDNITLEAWINPSVLPQTDGMVINNGTNAAGYGFSVGGNGASNAKLYLIFNVIAWFDTGYTFPTANTWYHVVATRDSTTWRTYVNGVQAPLTSTQTPGTPTASNFEIGHLPQYSGRHFAGLIDEVKVYNYQRTPAQIAWEYNQGKPIVQFKLDECQGTTVYDSMGTGYTGTWSGSGGGSQTSTGSCTTNAATGWYNGRNGKINSSMNFDGTDDYINFGDNTTLGIGASNTTMTMSAWIYPTTLSGSNLIIIRKRGVNVGYQAYINGGTLSIHIGNQSSFSLTASDYISINTWNLFTVVADGTNHVLYINGKNVASVASTTTINDSTGNNLVVGGNPGYFPGQIDDVRLYNYALTPAQVQMLYNSSTSVNFAPVTGTP